MLWLYGRILMTEERTKQILSAAQSAGQPLRVHRSGIPIMHTRFCVCSLNFLQLFWWLLSTWDRRRSLVNHFWLASCNRTHSYLDFMVMSFSKLKSTQDKSFWIYWSSVRNDWRKLLFRTTCYLHIFCIYALLFSLQFQLLCRSALKINSNNILKCVQWSKIKR